MNEEYYFDTVNYNGKHLHVDNYKDEYTSFIEGIAWVRRDGSMDLFFDDFEANRERQELFIDRGFYTEEFKGGYIGSAKIDEEVFKMFRKWVNEVLYPYRGKGKTLNGGTE